MNNIKAKQKRKLRRKIPEMLWDKESPKMPLSSSTAGYALYS